MTEALSDFDFVRTIVRNTSAIVLGDDKDYLIRSRLAPLAESEGFESIGSLIRELRISKSLLSLQAKVVDALTTNETSFFRDHHPFIALREHVLPELIERRAATRSLRIWSAACSSGQEAYSIAMLIREHFPELSGWNVTILGTDISETMLERARAGVYTHHEVNRGLPARLLVKYFNQRRDGFWTVSGSIREIAAFRSLNLVQPWPPPIPFDLIFLRNVLIYFDAETKRSVLDRIGSAMAGGGWLSLGAAETPLFTTDAFTTVPIGRSTFYRPRQT